ncbi:MAG: peptide chain release factor N(5)-glutamine methyltransferase [Gammaproteobacteria bacterium]
MNLENIELVEDLYKNLLTYKIRFPAIVKDTQDFILFESLGFHLLIHNKIKLTIFQKEKIQHFLDLYLIGVPFEYITNKANFYGNSFLVNNNVLIPRPETELIIDAVKEIDPKGFSVIADIGTGSGCIAISLAHIFDQAKIIATDNSEEAIKIAKINVINHSLVNVYPILANLLECFQNESLDILVSNPPYIAKNDSHLESLIHEPISALVSDDFGLKHIKEIMVNSFHALKKDGYLVIEHGYDQSLEVNKISRNIGFKLVKNVKDHQDIDRIHICKK